MKDTRWVNGLECLQRLGFRALVLLCFGAAATGAARAQDGILEAEQAFRLHVDEAAGGKLRLHWDIAPGYYLYRERLTVQAPAGQARPRVQRPPGEAKTDPNFGRVHVYHHAVDVDVAPGTATTLTVGWQGCAEQGVCYPPQRRTVSLQGGRVSAASARPAALQALEKKGVSVVGTFPAPGGLTAWAGYTGQRPVALYATPDGKHVIAGTLFDGDGKEAAQDALEKAVRGPMSDEAWMRLESSRWIQDGKAAAPRVVYVFTDPNCPYCNKFWSDARPWVDGGKVVLRHVLVGVLTSSSPGKAAALLAARNPQEALAAYEARNAERTRAAIASGRARPLADDSLHPVADIPPAIRAQLAANEKLMASLGVEATPALAWRDAAGVLQVRTGAPDSALPAILGPR